MSRDNLILLTVVVLSIIGVIFGVRMMLEPGGDFVGSSLGLAPIGLGLTCLSILTIAAFVLGALNSRSNKGKN